MSKRVVHFVNMSSTPGGIEVLFPVIIKSMPDYDFKALVIRKKIENKPYIYEALNIPVQFGGNNNLIALLKVFTYVFKNRKDIFHVFNTGPYFLLAIKTASAGKVLYSIHGTIYWRNKKQRILRKLFWKLALSKKFKITSNTIYSKSIFKRNISKKYPVQVIYNPIDINRFSPGNIEKKDNLFKIIYVGRLCRGKNLEKWINVAYRLHNLLPNTYFEIYGIGPLSELLKNHIHKLNASDYIFLKGFRNDIENVYREADLMLFLSEYESFGNVVVECILCGTPALASDIPAIREIFKDFPEFILKTGDKIEDEIYNFLLNIEYFRERALSARESFLKRFSIKNHIEKLQVLYGSFENQV